MNIEIHSMIICLCYILIPKIIVLFKAHICLYGLFHKVTQRRHKGPLSNKYKACLSFQVGEKYLQ